jgi:hypothetical protein
MSPTRAAIVLVALASLPLAGMPPTMAATSKPALGRACKVAQIGTVSGGLVCTRSGKSAVWRRSPATTTTVLDPATAPAGTVLSRETFDNPATSTWPATGGDGWTAGALDGRYRIAAAPPAPGRVGPGAVFPGAARAEWSFEMTLTPGAQSLASINLSCLDSGSASEPFNFLLIDVRADGRIVASRYDNTGASQQPTRFFDRGFSNQDRFDRALIHPGTKVSLRCLRDGANAQVVLTLDGTVVMDTTTTAPSGAGDRFTLYLTTFTAGFRDAAELLIDNAVITKQ